MDCTMPGICLALIGGGRWGRTHAGVLAQFSARIGRVLWVSHHNRSALDRFLAENPCAAPTFELFPSLDAALAEKPDAALVVTAASDHASIVEILLQNDVPTLVEKPLALNVLSAERLIELAEQRKVLLCVALHLLKADFLQYFRQLWAGRRIASIDLDWFDPDFEKRHGEIKSSNLTTNKADEVVSHLWSILSVLQNEDEPQLRVVKPRSLGAVELGIDIGSSRATVLFGRRAAARKRSIKLAFSDGGTAQLDFTAEPGRITIDGADHPNLESCSRVGPLAVELRDFLDIVDCPQDMSSSTQLASRCLGSVSLAENVRERLMEEEANAIVLRLADGGSMHDADVAAWLIDNIAPLLGAEGMRIESTDQEMVDRIIEAVHQAVTEESSWSEASPPTEESRAVMSIIRKSRFFALLMKQMSAVQNRKSISTS
jgi:hypothetical protein